MIKDRCINCNHEIFWFGDDDLDPIDYKNFSVRSTYNCPNCGCVTEVYRPREDSKNVKRKTRRSFKT
jgi:uncharacterized protein with PIN domain